MTATFDGFPRRCVRFFEELRANNDKLWFDAHRADYDAHVMEPSRAFVGAMGERLRDLSPALNADPKVNRSLFRIHRDTRFSEDKTPFKTTMGIWFWEGDRKRMESSGFYFHLEPPNLMLGVGVYRFPKPQLAAYREAVADDRFGAELARIVDELTADSDWGVGGQNYKRVPRGYPADHPRAGLLRHDGLHAGLEEPIPEAFCSAALLDYCYERFAQLEPLHRWLADMIARM